jgi:serine/threonine-protein kinase
VTTPTTVTPTTATPATTVAVTPTATPTPTTTVAVAPTTTPTPTATDIAQPIAQAAAIAGWVDQYPLQDCEFAEATTVALNTATIEAFGTSAEPFQALARDFEAAHDFSPNIEVRQLNPTQCTLANFLRDVRPMTTAGGPKVASVESRISGEDAEISGTIEGLDGLNAYVYLLDAAGRLRDTALPATGSATRDFAITIPAADQASQPMAIIVVSTKKPLENVNFKSLQQSKVMFGVIRRNIVSTEQTAQVAVQYFKLGDS